MWTLIALVASLAILVVVRFAKVTIPHAVEGAAVVILALYAYELSSGILHRSQFSHQQILALVTGWTMAIAAVKLRDHK